MNLTRRDLGKLALAAMPASRLLAKPNSNFDGVQIGTITYSYRSMPGGNDSFLICASSAFTSSITSRCSDKAAHRVSTPTGPPP